MGSCGRTSPVRMEQRWNLYTPDLTSITEDRWLVAEETIQEVVNCIRPTLDTEEKRKDVIDYVQRLIRCSLGCEVFTYGSVPLKTYLPDGDIDLTALSNNYCEARLAHDVLAVLQEEENRENAEFDVKDTQFIDAEVKLVKCLVQNFVIDISFNQLGGLCSLCFLEQIDRLVGKNHLFKRSIILAKAWCYYESRILGAHHGLISTYALEILVLYIVHMYHSSLSGPLAVLYRFLDYYSKFDWDIYCVSLNGPVRKASLPDIMVDMPDNARNNVLLSEEFLRNCMEMFTVPSRDAEMNTRALQQKHLNIIDPLKENNNLGRSVHKGNFHRIRSAFKYGARKLGRILLSPSDRVPYEIKKFFANTLERHGSKHLARLQNSGPNFADEDVFSSLFPAEFYSEDDILLKLSEGDLENDNVETVCKCSPRSALESNWMNGAFSCMVSENGYFLDGQAVSGLRLSGDANDLRASISMNLNVANGTSECSGTVNNISSPSGRQYSSSHCDFSEPCVGHEDCAPGTLCHNDLFDCIDERLRSDLWVETIENPLESSSIYQSGSEYSEGMFDCSAISSPKTSSLESLPLDIQERDSASFGGDVEAINPLVDLTGDYDSHIRSLLYGQCCHGFSLSAAALSNYPSSPSWYQSENFWDTVQQSMLRHQSSSQMTLNNMPVCPTVQLSCYSLPATAMFSSKMRESAQGTGTYSVNTNYSCPEIHKGWDQNLASGTYTQLHMYNSNHINGWVPAFSDNNSSAKCNQEVSGVQSTVQRHVEFSVSGQPHHVDGWVPAFSDTNSSGKCTQEVSGVQSIVQGHTEFAVSGQSHHCIDDSHANDFSNSSCSLEFGSLGKLSHSSHDVLPIPSVSRSVPCSKPASGENGRTSEQNFSLKNIDEFPPL
ncbi:hypothetical protein HAX54_041424 [Datura stramonium]|uniref:PAP/OAS1 substrate-binding domain superfamily n=1 Tax=Datura stramonium TaxID=4076 RepID=A0ABS8VQJ9_DATST|nr:hypothetical protein [Datura stramonium]